MSRRRLPFAYAFFLFTVTALAGRCVLGAEPGGPASRALDVAADPRLARVEPIALPGEPLADALQALTSQTGVRLEAAREVAELKVMLRGQKLPLQRVLQETADLLDLTWTRRGAGPEYRYECARSQAATSRAREALEKARATNRAAVQAQLTRIAEAFRKGDPGSLAATDPGIADAMSDPNNGDGARTLLGALAQFPAEGLQAMTLAGPLTTTWDQMPPQAQEYVRRETQQNLPMALGNIPGKDGNSIGYETFLKSASYTMGVSGLDDGGNNFYGEIRVAGMSMRIGVDLGMPNPASTTQDTSAPVGKAATDPPPARRPLPPVTERLAGGKRMSVHEIVDWLAEKAPFAVVSDYYATRYERHQVSVPAGATAADALAAMERAAAVEWNISPDDRVLRLRSRAWPLDDQREPPAAIVTALEKALQAHDQPDLSDYVLASQLTDAQGAGLGQIDATKFGALARALDGSRPVLKDALRLWGMLPLGQRAAAASPAGLPAAQLTPAQRATLGAHLLTMRNDLRPEDLDAAVFRIRRQTPSMPGAPAPPAPAAAATLETVVFTIEFSSGRPATSTSVAVHTAAPR